MAHMLCSHTVDVKLLVIVVVLFFCYERHVLSGGGVYGEPRRANGKCEVGGVGGESECRLGWWEVPS